MELNIQLSRLNRIARLYANAWVGREKVRPYRLSQLRACYESMLFDFCLAHEVIYIDDIVFSDHFPGRKLELDAIAENKSKAVAGGHYEEAAQLRDSEKCVMQDFLLDLGINSRDTFFIYNGRVYMKS